MSQPATKLATSTYGRLSVMMFLQFFVWGGFFVTMGRYLSVLFAGDENLNSIIGDAFSTSNWGALIAPLFVGVIADRFLAAEKVNALCHLLGGVLLWMAAQATTSSGFFWTMMGFFICYMPTLALVNSISFNVMSNPDKQFPAVRVWGTVGWIAALSLVGGSLFGIIPFGILQSLVPVTDAAGDAIPLRDTSVPLMMCAILSLVYGLYSFSLPHTPTTAKGQPFSVGKAFGFDAIKLLAKPSFFVFALCSFLVSIPLAFYYAMGENFIGAVQFGEKAPSISSIGQASEVLFMLAMPFFLLRLGIKWTLLIGMLAWVLRYLLFGYAPLSATALIIAVALHGVCFDFFFVAGQLYTDKVAPRVIRSSAQGLIGLITYGAGQLVGNKVLGVWGDRLGLDPSSTDSWLTHAATYWSMPAFFALAVAILFFFGFWDKTEIEADGDNTGLGKGKREPSADLP